MNENMNGTGESRRNFLKRMAAAAAIPAILPLESALAQELPTPPGLNTLTPRSFRYTLRREQVDFPAADLLTWVREDLMKDAAFLKGLQGVSPDGAVTPIKSIVLEPLPIGAIIFKGMKREQQILWLDFFAGKEKVETLSRHIPQIEVEAFQRGEQKGTSQCSVRVTFADVPGVSGGPRSNVVLMFSVAR